MSAVQRIGLDDIVAVAFPAERSSAPPPDVAQGLRDLAATVAGRRAGGGSVPSWAVQASTDRHTLELLARSVVNSRSAAAEIGALTQDSAASADSARAVADPDREIEGARVFGCLLYLTGHPHSARFWWQIAGGAGDSTSAYCLYLHHRQRGETHTAGLWLDTVAPGYAQPGLGAYAPSLPPLPQELMGGVFGTGAPPTQGGRLAGEGQLAGEVERLVVHLPGDDNDGIAVRPGPALAARLRELIPAGHSCTPARRPAVDE
ncbi:hypothetical protein ACEZCY_34925 [Streptacidiphilus sp. N1-12]|uniref:Uncharacterized protein n=2 Tax=Streptacidiphilus alkalitolerans TaxID=3342712 RepID=A0ABV6WR10_9ACTN